jgi:TolC family type I secretion outer membrane protein
MTMKKISAFLLCASLYATPALAADIPIPAFKPKVMINSTSTSITNNQTLFDVIQTGLATSPDVMSSLQSVRLAQENIDLARAGYRPDVRANAEIGHLQGKNDVTDEWQSDTGKTVGVSVQQALYRGGRTTASVNESEAITQARINGFYADIHDKIADIVDVYMAVYEAKESVQANTNNRNRLSERLKATRAGFDVGELTRTDVAQAQARLANAEADLVAAKAVLDVAYSDFTRVTGIVDDMEFIYPDIDVSKIPNTLDEAITIAEQNNPLLKSVEDSLKAQDFNVDEQEGAFLPEISLNAGLDAARNPVGRNFDREETASVSLNATLPLYQSGVLRNNLRQAKIERDIERLNVEDTRRNVKNRVISAWENMQSIAVQIDARKAQLKAAQIAQNGVALEQTVGARSILDVLDANQDVKDAELALIRAQSESVRNYYELLAAIGGFDRSLWDNLKTNL